LPVTSTPASSASGAPLCAADTWYAPPLSREIRTIEAIKAVEVLDGLIGPSWTEHALFNPLASARHVSALP
jgi:hypothetical protein